jgi:hypothetical protein
MQLLLPQLNRLRLLNQELVPLANSYRQAGDEASAQAALQMGVTLGQRLDVDGPAGQTALNNLVGIAIQGFALRAMNPNSPYGDNGQTVQDRINQLTQQRVAFVELYQQFDLLMPTMSDQDWISYTDRARVFGEQAARRWLVNKYGQK